MSYLFSFIARRNYSEFRMIEYNHLIIYTAALLLLLIFFFLIRKKRDSRMWMVHTKEYILLVFTGLCFFVVIGATQSIVSGGRIANNSTFMRITALSCCVLGIAMYFLLIWQVKLGDSLAEYREKEKNYSHYLEMQDARIREIIESDKTTRKFRHDIRAHITALEAGIEKKDIELVREYVKSMRENEKDFELKSYTGIVSIDALISEAQERAEEKGIKWRYNGNRIQNMEEGGIYDLCIILSNLMNNAIEGAEKTEEKAIELDISRISEKIVITIVNTCTSVSITDSIEHTSKADAMNHGFGIENVRETVSKYKGEVSFKVENGLFKATVIM